MLRASSLTAACVLTLMCISSAMAQGGGGGGGRGGRGGGPGGHGGPGGAGMDAAMQAGPPGGHQLNQGNQGNMNNAMMAQAMQNQNQNQNQQNMPTISQLATTLLSTYDMDKSGSLDIAELQAALSGLRSMMASNQQNNNIS